ncbi:YvcK family protein [Candidatus Woesebacteria bacterium]|nr:YvcK family protein [Candidatus Woesebacteria bacterium]
MKKVTVIGGGTGTFVVLSGLKQYDLDLGAIVTMMDSGGSTGRLRDQLGVLPPGDVRQCMVALSDATDLWRKLFLYRFENGDLKGHNFGNIFISALEKVCDDYDTVLETASTILNTKGPVMPVTFEKAHLCVEYENGTVLKGESVIDEDNPETARIKRAYIEPQVAVNPDAVKRIQESDFIIIGPGDLYTSIVPVFLVDHLKEELTRSKAQVIYNLNLMTKLGQTTGYEAIDHIRDLEKYIGRCPEYVVTNTGEIPQAVLEWYDKHDERPVLNNLRANGYKGTIIEEDIINRSHIEKSSADTLTRSVLRHDSDKLATILFDIIQQSQR